MPAKKAPAKKAPAKEAPAKPKVTPPPVEEVIAEAPVEAKSPQPEKPEGGWPSPKDLGSWTAEHRHNT